VKVAHATTGSSRAGAVPFPSLEHLHYSEFESIYEPAEDTFLLCDALADAYAAHDDGDAADAADGSRSSSSSSLRLPASGAAASPALCVEIGPGSGAVTAHLLALLAARGRARPLALCLDVSPRACAATLRTARANGCGGRVEAALGDLLGCALPRLAGAADVLLFNPPYVPTPDAEVLGPGRAAALAARAAAAEEEEEEGGSGDAGSGSGAGGDMLAATWAGGARGRRVLDRALPQIARALAPRGGAAFIVLVEENGPSEVARAAAALGLAARVVRRATARNERLLVMRLTKE